MMIRRNIMMGIASLIASKQRSLLALLGIVIGIGSVIAMVSIGIIVKEYSLKQFLALGTDFILIEKGWSMDVDSAKITAKMVDQLPTQLPDLLEVSPVGSSIESFTYRGKSYSPSILATAPNFLKINRFGLEKGRYISALDKNVPYCVIGKDVANELEKNGVLEPLGILVKMKEKLFTVIGVLNETPVGGLKPFNANRSFIIPFSTYEWIFEGAEISSVLGRMRPDANPKAVTQNIKNFFTLRNPDLEIEVSNAKELIEQRKKQNQMFTLLLGAIGSISLIVGGVGVMNVMLVSVTERKQEIGIRRALGALQRDIQVQFLIESVLLCLVGGFIGMVLGIGASYFIAKHNGWDFLISNIAIIIGVGVSTLVGIFFGYYPARQASKLDPIVALRS